MTAFPLARSFLRKSAVCQEHCFNVHLKCRQFQAVDLLLKWYKPTDDLKLGKGWIGPYVGTKVISDVAYELQAHPKLQPKAVHVAYLKLCRAWASKDNWFKNPEYVCPQVTQVVILMKH